MRETIPSPKLLVEVEMETLVIEVEMEEDLVKGILGGSEEKGNRNVKESLYRI